MAFPLGSRLRSSCIAALALAALASPPPAQTWAQDSAAPGLGGRVFAFRTWQGAMHAGGHPFAAVGGELGCVARWDGQRWRGLGAGLALGSGWGPFATATVRAMCEFQGDLVVAGTFDTAGGAPANHIARWNGSSWAPLGQGLLEIGWDAEVRALAVFQNELYATGTFGQAGGQPAAGIARWNGTSWTPCGAGLQHVAGSAGSGHCLLVRGTELLVGGDFTGAGGIAAACVARWNGSTWAPLGAGFDGTVRALADWQGQIVAAGSFGASGSTMLSGPAVWTGTAWQSLGSGGPGQVTSLHPFAGHLYAGGAFPAPGPCLARWDGTAWSGIGGVAGVFSGSIATIVLALGSDGSRLLVGGEFTRGGSPPQGAAAVVSTGAVAFDGTTWQAIGRGAGVHGVVAKVVRWRDGLVAVGQFESAGNTAAAHCAFFDGDDWRRIGTFDLSVSDAVVLGDDLVVSGAFTSIDGQPIAGMARFDGVSWHQFGPGFTVPLAVHQGQLLVGGTNALRRWNGTSFVDVATVPGIVDRLHVHADGNLWFSTATFNAHRIYRWNGAAATLVGTPNDFVHCLGSFGGELLAGGRFTAVSGATTGRLARWNGTGWSAVGGGIGGYAVDATCELDGRLYAACNGDPRGFLLQWDGMAWQAVPGGPDGVPRCLFPDAADGSVRAFGALGSAGGMPAWNHAQWRTRPRWTNRRHGLPRAHEGPELRGAGAALAGTSLDFQLSDAPGHLALLMLGTARIDLPLLGGTLVPWPEQWPLLLGDAAGRSAFALAVPPLVPPGTTLFAQAWLLDPSGPQGWLASNTLQVEAP